jgi:hypothetical protein
MTTIIDPLTVSSMNDITVNSWTTFFVIFGILLAIMAIIASVWYDAIKGLGDVDKQREQYEKFYFYLQRYVKDWKVTEENYLAIDKFFDILESFSWKDKKRTNALRNKFLEKYQSIRDEIDSRDEFSPGQVFKK